MGTNPQEIETMAKVLAAFKWNMRRMGSVEGLFITTEDELEKAYGRKVYFGEILGKHSEVSGTLDRGDIAIKSTNQAFLTELEEVIGAPNVSGYNPLCYLEDSDDEI
jgi:hypothetical protein